MEFIEQPVELTPREAADRHRRQRFGAVDVCVVEGEAEQIAGKQEARDLAASIRK